MSDLITPKEFLQNKYKYYKKHWNEHEVIDDEFIVGEMQAYSDYVQSQANGENKEQDKALRLPEVVGSALKDDERVHYEALQDCCKKILKAVDSGKVPQRGIMGLRLLMPK